MERLTNEDGICINCEGLAYCRLDCQNKKIYDKLKQYEDLGFTPTDIAYLAKFYKEQTSPETIANHMKIVAKLLAIENSNKNNNNMED